jgi:hypothetical protein
MTGFDVGGQFGHRFESLPDPSLSCASAESSDDR